ncbi:MAG: hypothetical protein FWD34_09295 [Oscillospiraceae bacterium]|nr:hypothetical protein [Oscillospiraceae bacterium]
MKNNKIAESIKKIMPDEIEQDRILEQILVRKNNLTIRKENQDMNIKKPHSVKKLATVIIAAAFALSLLTIVAFAYSEQIIQMLGGGQIEIGEDYVSISHIEITPVEIRDGQVYFILDGNNTDITSYCTESTYYEYEVIAENSIRHVFIVGGTPDKLGWAEYIWDNNGVWSGSTCTFFADINDEKPEWLKLADEAFLPR